MKQHITKLLILIPLLFIAGGAFAAYTFIAPTAAPTSNNTDGPLDISATDQIKNGGLAVNTFQSRTGSDFAQQTSFAGLVRGGVSTDTHSSIPFGTAAKTVSVSNVGNIAVAGNYQSDSLKTGGGNKPLCADQNGTFYICGAATTPTNTSSIYLGAQYEGDDRTIVAALSEPITSQVVVTISASSGNAAAVSYLKNMFTADARQQGVCYYTATPTVVGTVTIEPDSTVSSDSVTVPQGCEGSNLTISSYSPHTSPGGRAIVTQ